MLQTVKTVVLVRHARSTANDDPSVYLTVPDHAIPLARPDDDPAALAAGDALRGLGLDPALVCSWYSPYLRCRQTQDLVLARAFGDAAGIVRCRESFLLREQEFGDWDSLTDAEIAAEDPARHARLRRMTDALGRFYFRYPHGESRADVVERMTLFLGKLHRSRYADHVVFLHGVTQRAFRMAWMNLPAEWFETEPNPGNASVLRIARETDGRWGEAFLVPRGEPPQGAR
jgi:broad specificity phosphatase PhoE